MSKLHSPSWAGEWRADVCTVQGAVSQRLVLVRVIFPQPQLLVLTLFKCQPLMSRAGLGTALVTTLSSYCPCGSGLQREGGEVEAGDVILLKAEPHHSPCDSSARFVCPGAAGVPVPCPQEQSLWTGSGTALHLFYF